MKKSAAIALAALAFAGTSSVAEAHAFLDHAVPGVGATVPASPSELALAFTQDIVPALSSVRVAAASGGGIAVAKPVGQGNTLHVHLARPLAPGTYVVTWHVVSVDTHPTSGHYKFTIAP